VALYDYAYFNQALLGNESIIVYPKESPNNQDRVIEKFQSQFPVYGYQDFSEVDQIIRQHQADLFYAIKAGKRDGKVSQTVPTMVHAVFPVKPRDFHGSAYAFVSDWLSVVCAHGKLPAVPHMVYLPDVPDHLREPLGIPLDATVFGCHGGSDSFDIPFVKETVIPRALRERSDIYFIFLNIKPFIKHERVIFLPASADLSYKTKFINTTDAMLHARKLGESFGLACGEFSVRNKPVITYSKSRQRHHLMVLGENALLYSGSNHLLEVIRNFNRTEMAKRNWDFYSGNFSPSRVMALFEKNLIQKALDRGISDTPSVEMDVADQLFCLKQALIMKWKKIALAWAR